MHACENETSYENCVYSVKSIEILPLPNEFTNIKVDCPGTQSLAESIFVSDHVNSTRSQLVFPYTISDSEVAIEDLTTESGLRTLNTHHLLFHIFQKGKHNLVTLKKKKVFDILKSENYEYGEYAMIIAFSNDEANPVKISYKRDQPERLSGISYPLYKTNT